MKPMTRVRRTTGLYFIEYYTKDREWKYYDATFTEWGAKRKAKRFLRKLQRREAYIPRVYK